MELLIVSDLIFYSNHKIIDFSIEYKDKKYIFFVVTCLRLDYVRPILMNRDY